MVTKRIALHVVPAGHGHVAIPVTRTVSDRPRVVSPSQFSRPTRAHIPLIHRGIARLG